MAPTKVTLEACPLAVPGRVILGIGIKQEYPDAEVNFCGCGKFLMYRLKIEEEGKTTITTEDFSIFRMLTGTRAPVKYAVTNSLGSPGS